jgi:hypothetical protein
LFFLAHICVGEGWIVSLFKEKGELKKENKKRKKERR